MTARIRLARESDAAQLLAIYAPFVQNTPVTFEIVVPTEQEFAERIRNTVEYAPWLVCESGGRILGYTYAGRYRPRAAYQWTVEVTVYVDPTHHRNGIARALYTSLFECLRLQGFFNAFAVIALPNPASVAVHESLGFRPVGVFHSAGYKLGSWRDVGWWEFAIQPPAPNPPAPRTLPETAGHPSWDAAVSSGLRMLH
jgi:L-amino acid N-acyltransferase YncA